MKTINKLKLIKNPFDIFTMKTGKIFKLSNKCYRANIWFRVFFRFYYGGLFLFPLFYFFNNSLFEYSTFTFQLIESILFLILLDLILVFFIPLEEVSCYRSK